MAKMTELPTASSILRMNLFAPGMSVLHRAGLGGLACTLKAIETAFADGRLSKEKLPGPFEDDEAPWSIDEQSVTLRFEKPNQAGGFLERLFVFAFGLRNDGLIHLPGQFGPEVSAAVLADMQLGLTLTFLQHGKVRKLDKDPVQANYDPHGDGLPGIVVEYRTCRGFKHQELWRDFVDSDGCLVANEIRVDGPISPGAVVRHVAFTGDTSAKDPPARMLPLVFALVGCLPLAVNRGVAALIVPEVENLLDFILDRPAMSPTTARECQVANAADAALQAQVRLRAKRSMLGSTIPGCLAMTFAPTPWAKQQKSRVSTLHVPAGAERVLDRFERALLHLPTEIVSRTVRESIGKGKQKKSVERIETFRSTSVIRPLIAENLALDRPWYSGFVALMTRIDPASGNPIRDRLSFERKGLHAMIEDEQMWDNAGEETIVRAVHEALRNRYGQIAEENKNNPAAMRNRFAGEYDKWRLAFSGSKTPDQFRRSLSDLFSRAGGNSVLKQHWQEVLPMLRPTTWQHARDLALIGLCSYQGRADNESETESN